MSDPKLLPPAVPAAPTKLAVWADQSGTPYLVQRQDDGSTSFILLETVLAQARPQTTTTTTRITTYRDPLTTLLLGAVVGLGFVLGGYSLGFLAGAAGQRVVLVPSTPVCNTHRSSVLFWTTETKECN